MTARHTFWETLMRLAPTEPGFRYPEQQERTAVNFGILMENPLRICLSGDMARLSCLRHGF